MVYVIIIPHKVYIDFIPHRVYKIDGCQNWGYRMTYITLPDVLGIAIRNERINQKLTQQALAEQAGVFQKTISALENRTASVSIETLFKVLGALELQLTLSDRHSTVTGVASEW